MSTPRPFLYLKPGCPWCDEAEDYLQEHGIAYGKADVNADPVAYDEMKRLSGQTKAPTMRWGDWENERAARSRRRPSWASRSLRRQR